MEFDQALWNQLQNVAFDNLQTDFPFTNRLARDNRWSYTYADRVVEEYRRFAYLAMTAGHEVTPSDEVDQAWHLHLTYTRHYWGEFTEALGGPLHHGPTQGGVQEKQRYADNYAQTLNSYRAAFGENPPADIWPDHTIRFGDAPHMQRINTRSHFVISKAGLRDQAARAGIVAAVGSVFSGGVALAASSGTSEGVHFLERIQNTPFLIIGMALVVAVLLLLMGVFANRSGKKTSNKASAGGAGFVPFGGDGDGGNGGSGCGSGCGGCGG